MTGSPSPQQEHLPPHPPPRPLGTSVLLLPQTAPAWWSRRRVKCLGHNAAGRGKTRPVFPLPFPSEQQGSHTLTFTLRMWSSQDLPSLQNRRQPQRQQSTVRAEDVRLPENQVHSSTHHTSILRCSPYTLSLKKQEGPRGLGTILKVPLTPGPRTQDPAHHLADSPLMLFGY